MSETDDGGKLTARRAMHATNPQASTTPPAPKARRLLFTGDGKGETTAALGMALRASGHGHQVLILQFVKSDASTGEVAALSRLPNVEVAVLGRGFVPRKTSPAFEAHQRAAHDGLMRAREALAARACRLLVLDEVVTACALGLLSEDAVVELVDSAPADITIVLTGRGASQRLIDTADTVTEMRCVRHAFATGRPADEGVEF